MSDEQREIRVTMTGVTVRVELRDLPRVKALVWELRQLEADLPAIGGVLGAERLTRILDRFFADVADDES